MDKSRLVSRRAWMRKAIVMTSAVAAYPLMGGSPAKAATQEKVTKTVAHYQDQPHDGKMCGMCKHFIPSGGAAGHGMMGHMGPGMMKEGTCQVVQGRISPKGYCILYMPV